ncbi:unnamed protein product [Owenia fusiformis]|uniref:Amino acid transporter n=1 Tax=Owenia fusiformis TaxID=6347 RepID=A0A8S4NH54_OWEFU|nr:unnamed protein product [Owenia fusiformis]
MWVGLPGELFLNMLHLLVVPIVITSGIRGASTMGLRADGKIIAVALAYSIMTMTICSCIGLLLGVAVRPGEGVRLTDGAHSASCYRLTDVFADFIRKLIPRNLLQRGMSCIEYQRTNMSNTTDVANYTTYGDEMNILGIYAVSIAFGIAAHLTGSRGKPALVFLQAVQSIVLKLIKGVFYYAPVGVTSLIAKAILKVPAYEMNHAFTTLGYFTLSTTIGQLFHQLVVLPAIYFIVCRMRKNPYTFMWKLCPALVTGFISGTSVPALPCLYLCTKTKVNPHISSLVIPLSVPLKKDGSALFISLSLVFIAQMAEMKLTATQIITIGGLSIVLGFTTQDIPSGSILTISLIGGVTGIPVSNDSLGLIIGLEWLNDRLRTSTNVQSHAFSCVFVEKTCRKELQRIARANNPSLPTDMSLHIDI